MDFFQVGIAAGALFVLFLMIGGFVLVDRSSARDEERRDREMKSTMYAVHGRGMRPEHV